MRKRASRVLCRVSVQVVRHSLHEVSSVSFRANLRNVIACVRDQVGDSEIVEGQRPCSYACLVRLRATYRGTSVSCGLGRCSVSRI